MGDGRNNMLYLIPYFSDVYKENADGSSKLIARDVLRHHQIDLDLIDNVTEYLNSKGKVVKNMSVISHRDLGQMIVNMPCDKLWELRKKQNGFEIRGFKIELNEKQKTKNGKRKIGKPGRDTTKVRKANSK